MSRRFKLSSFFCYYISERLTYKKYLMVKKRGIMGKINLQLNKKMMALIVAGGLVLTPISDVFPDTAYKQGTFVKDIEEND